MNYFIIEVIFICEVSRSKPRAEPNEILNKVLLKYNKIGNRYLWSGSIRNIYAQNSLHYPLRKFED